MEELNQCVEILYQHHVIICENMVDMCQGKTVQEFERYVASDVQTALVFITLMSMMYCIHFFLHFLAVSLFFYYLARTVFALALLMSNHLA